MIRYAVILALLVSGEWPLCCGCCESAPTYGTTESVPPPSCSHCESPAAPGSQVRGDVPVRHHCSDDHSTCPRGVTLPYGADNVTGEAKHGAQLPTPGSAGLLCDASRNRRGTSVTGQSQGRPVPTPILLCCLLR